MPLHLLGKKSWNVYNPANIARVKADEAAAAAREAAQDERLQEIDAARRAAILRGETPPPLPEEDIKETEKKDRREGHERKRRKLAGEDDTDMDIRLATSVTRPKEGDEDRAKTLMLRNPDSDAPLTDHAGNINLFPVDVREVAKRGKNEEAEKEKRKKERALEDQYTMRFSNAAGRGRLEHPWYTSSAPKATEQGNDADKALQFAGFGDKDVWGNEDPRRKEREKARITSNDPFAFMQKAQVQLKKSKEDREKWADERERRLKELRATQDRVSRGDKHAKRKKRAEEDDGRTSLHGAHRDGGRTSRHKHHHRSRSRSRERRYGHGRHGTDTTRESDHRRRRKRSRSPSQERSEDRLFRRSVHRYERGSRDDSRSKDQP